MIIVFTWQKCGGISRSFYEIISNLDNDIDFYLPIYNMCIEYDGIQHFDDNEYSMRAIKFFGGSDAHIKRKISDQKKTEFCIERGINLIRIDYKQYSKINNILDDTFKKI